MQMIENYLHSLQSYLPEDIREEVRDELESSIMDQVDDKQNEVGRELTTEELEAILLNIGHPMKVAAAYSPNQELIGRDYFPIYKKTLELVIAFVLIASLLFKLPFIFSDANFLKIGIVIAASFFENAVLTFAWITLIFWILQTNNVDISGIYKWSPSQLTSSQPKLKISRLETLFEIFVYLIFLGWWNDGFQWAAHQVFENVDQIVRLSDEWQSVFWSVNIIIGLSILVDSIKFVSAGWSKATLAANMALNLASLAILAQVVRFNELVIVKENSLGNIPINVTLEHAHNLALSIISIIAAITIWEIYSNYRKIIS